MSPGALMMIKPWVEDSSEALSSTEQPSLEVMIPVGKYGAWIAL